MSSQAIGRRKKVSMVVRKIILWLEIAIILVVGAGVGVFLGAFYQMNKLLPPDAALDAYRPPVGTKIYSSDRVLLAKLATENREPVGLDDIPNTRDVMGETLAPGVRRLPTTGDVRADMAATEIVGMFWATASNAWSKLALMKKSSLPTGSKMRLLTCGPPGTMVTSRPYRR